MKLNIVDPETLYMHQAFGISLERRQELMTGLDRLMAGLKYKGPFRVSELMEAIAAMCNTTEELVLAVYHNSEFLTKSKDVYKFS